MCRGVVCLRVVGLRGGILFLGVINLVLCSSGLRRNITCRIRSTRWKSTPYHLNTRDILFE